MHWHRTAFVFAILLFVGCRQDPQTRTLEVTYTGNEGFLIAMGDTKILVDALSDSKYYVSPSDSLVAGMMEGAAPFDGIDYFLVTHDHADHFNPEKVSHFLLAHPAVRFVASSQTCNELMVDSPPGRQIVAIDLGRGERRTVRGGEAEVRALRLDHGGFREVCNLAYLVTANGRTFLHVGDARLVENEAFLRAVDWDACKVDILFLEFFDRGSDVQSLIETLIKPKWVVLMHIPGGEEENVRTSGEKVHAKTVVFGKEGETRKF